MDQRTEPPVLSQKCFTFFKEIAALRAGIVLSHEKKEMVYNRLSHRLHELKLNSFDAYANLIRNNLNEEGKFINLMTNATTGFFREPHHFKVLTDYLTHSLPRKNKIRIWSAGCSTGEEAYSIAIILDEMHKDIPQDVKVLATDIDSDCLEIAKKGIYELKKIETLDFKAKQRFYRGIGKQTGFVKVIERVQNLVIFRLLNLIETWPIKTSFDVIFCRNVTIYFDQKTTKNVLNKLDKLLKPSGLLMLGETEQLHDLKPRYALVGQSSYQKQT